MLLPEGTQWSPTCWCSIKELKLARMDLLILMVLATYWRSADDMPWPSKDTIATMLDVDPQTVRCSVKKMEELGYVRRVFRQSSHRDNLSNKYDMRGLARGQQAGQGKS